MITGDFSSFNSPVRTINAKLELYENGAIADVYNKYYALKEFTIERIGESKFFGFGICQRLNVHLVDKDRNIYITTIDSFRPYLSASDTYANCFPEFYVTEVHRDENTNELSITAYDAIYKANQYTVADLGAVATPYTIGEFAERCAELLGVGLALPSSAESFDLMSDDDGANFDGSETLREALNAIAEATQTIYYINADNKLVFKMLDVSGSPSAAISKAQYFTLDSSTNRRLSTIAHVTELGDNISSSTGETGTTQYIRDNPFWDLRDDIGALVDSAIAAVGGLTINQFYCEWRGNPLLEIGDKVIIITKDDSFIAAYLLDDVIYYDGTLSQETQWSYEDTEEEAANPSNLGDAIKQTFARVDKVNKQIDLVASDVNSNSEAISNLQLTTDGISAAVTQVEENTQAALDGISGNIETLTNTVAATMSAEDVTIAIQSAIDNGVDKVVTATGFRFDEEGLTVSKSDSEMNTTITENGMTVYKNDEAVLVANNAGVDAVNLRATTYLIIGNNSRFEDYGADRTGCFWIGG